MGNNACHGFVYEAALRHPGVVVMHESNLHHLMTEITIRRGDWDGYVRECEYAAAQRRASSPNACASWRSARITKACP